MKNEMNRKLAWSFCVFLDDEGFHTTGVFGDCGLFSSAVAVRLAQQSFTEGSEFALNLLRDQLSDPAAFDKHVAEFLTQREQDGGELYSVSCRLCNKPFSVANFEAERTCPDCMKKAN